MAVTQVRNAPTENVATKTEKNSGKGFQPTDLALIAVFAALIAVFSIIPAFFTIGAVPFALQMIIVALTPLVLGSLRGGAACALYAIVGLAGLPILAGGQAGPAVLVGPTGGYLVGYVVAAFIAGAVRTGILKYRPRRSLLPVVLAVVGIIDVIVVHICGVAWFMVGPLHMSFKAALAATAVFFGFDIMKAIVAALLATAIFAAFPRLMPARKG